MWKINATFTQRTDAMPDRTWNIFMELLRAGLWEQDLRLAAVPDTAGWEQVLQLGREQAVMGLLLRGIAHLPEEQQLPAGLHPVALAWEVAFSKVNVRYSHVQNALLEHLTAAGLHPVVQKGSEAAKYYINPSIRQAGDIDLFLPDGEFLRARELEPDAWLASDGAYVFVRDGVTVELHRRYYDIHLSPARLPVPASPCGEILLLSSHIFKHAMGPGVGCKQFCDLTRALTALEGRYDKQELAAALRRAGLLRWHRLLCSLLVADYGLDPACCLPGFRAVDPSRLRAHVRACGHFGLADAGHRRSRQFGAFAKKAATAGAFLRRLPFSLRYGARETLATIWGLALGNLRK